MRHTIIAATAAVLLAVTGCTTTPDTTSPTTQAATPSQTASIDPSTRIKLNAGDLATHITDVTIPEPGRVTVTTDLVDPRTSHSTQGIQAIAICIAAQKAGFDHVTVAESDGTTFALYGHPSYPEGKCSEV